MNIIENKLKSAQQEIGNRDGLKETKQILKKCKKVCDIECAKCMMNMIDENKSLKTLNLDNLAESLADDESNEECIKCNKYTALSKTIQNIIDNI